MSNQKGFTLIETLLYISIAAVIMIAMSTLLTIALQSRVKNQTIAEVEQVGSRALNLITQTIRNSEGINLPTKGASATTLSVDVLEPANDPTVFDLFGSTLQITEGVNSAVALSADNVAISSLVFKNFARANTSDLIQVQFTVAYKNPENRQEYDYAKTFTASASVRKQ